MIEAVPVYCRQQCVRKVYACFLLRRCGASWKILNGTIWSKYRTQASDQLWARLRLPVSRIMLRSVPNWRKSSLAFQRLDMCHKLCGDAIAMESVHIWYLLWRLEMHETVVSESRMLPSFGWSHPGRALTTHRNCREKFLQIRSERTMGTGSLSSSARWVRRYPCWKWLGGILCWTPSFPLQSLLEFKFLFEPILIDSFMAFVFVSVNSSFTVRVASEVVSSRIAAPLSQVARCFQSECHPRV